MNGSHVTALIVVDNPKAGEKLKVNGENYVIIKDVKFGLVVQLDPTYEPHRKQLEAQAKGWLFTRWGLILVIVVLGTLLFVKLAS